MLPGPSRAGPSPSPSRCTPHGHYDSRFERRPEEHDDGVKTFLGESGRFDGGEIVDIVVRQPATAVFVGRHLYNFFVADEPQVPAWPIEPPRDPDALRTLVAAYLESKGDIRAVLRVLFTSDFFKEAQFRRVKSPTELVTGVMNLVGFQAMPEPGVGVYQSAITAMGQELLNPPHRRGLAHRQGVDRRRDSERARELRGERGWRWGKARHQGDRRPGVG